MHTEENQADTFSHILFLLNNKHVMVEELLQLLVDKVDGELLESIVREDLKASDVEDGAEVDFLHARVDQSLIAFLNQPKEGSVIDRSSDASNSVCCLVHVLTFGHPLSANLPLKVYQIYRNKTKTLIFGFTKAVIKSSTSTSVSSAT